MGVCHNAQVEVWFDPVPGRTGRWHAVSLWDLGKDYGFARAFYTVAESLWPKDVEGGHILGAEFEETPETYDGKRHADGALVAALEVLDEVLWFPWAEEMRGHVERLVERGFKVRVLWWED